MATFKINNTPNVREDNNSLFKHSNDVYDKAVFLSDQPKWSLEEIILPKDIKNTVSDFILFCKHKDDLIKTWNLDKFLKGCTSIGINLYGEPGTGKSITAEAIAHALGKPIIRVDYSEIQDSKLGQSEKNLSLLFKKAEAEGAVIFLDEADGLLGKRTAAGTQNSGTNEIKSHLLTLIDRSNVIVVYATNLFKNFDRAFFRRILYHVKYPLPTHEELEQLWLFHLGDENIPKDKTNFSWCRIADASQGLTGGDIKNITLKLCVSVVSNNMKPLTTEVVCQCIDQYLESLDDSKGISTISMDSDVNLDN